MRRSTDFALVRRLLVMADVLAVAALREFPPTIVPSSRPRVLPLTPINLWTGAGRVQVLLSFFFTTHTSLLCLKLPRLDHHITLSHKDDHGHLLLPPRATPAHPQKDTANYHAVQGSSISVSGFSRGDVSARVFRLKHLLIVAQRLPSFRRILLCVFK